MQPASSRRRCEADEVDELFFGLEETATSPAKATPPDEAIAQPSSAKRRRTQYDQPPRESTRAEQEHSEVDDLFGVSEAADSAPVPKWLQEPLAAASPSSAHEFSPRVKREQQQPAVKREHRPTESAPAASLDWSDAFAPEKRGASSATSRKLAPSTAASPRTRSSRHTSGATVSSFEAEAAHLAAIKRESRPAAASAAPPPPEVYKPILSNRDVLFTAPILSAAEDQSDEPVFSNAPSTFSTNNYFATASSTQFPFMPKSIDELGKMIAERDDAPVALANQQQSQWPITMAGKSIATVSASNAVKAKLLRRASLEKEQEFQESSSTLPQDKHVHGPGISDHSTAKAHYDGYWELRTRKLAAQKANAAIYAQLEVFQTPQEKEQERERRRRKRRREEERLRQSQMGEEAQPEDVPFALGQATPADSVDVDDVTEEDERKESGLPSSAPRATPAAASPSSARRAPSSSARVPIFSGVVVYLNGGTETRSLSSGGVDELSSFHLANLIKLHGGHVLPYPSRSQLTHYVADHLSFSKARSEHSSLFVKRGVGAARQIHFVRPEWIRACMQAGRRVREEGFQIVQEESSRKIRDIWTAAASSSVEASSRSRPTAK
jgi:hypothetical protein